MTQEEFRKLQAAEKIIGQQKKLDLQIKNLSSCGSLKMVYKDNNNTYHVDIYARDFTGNNIMEWKAKQFIEEYRNHLECKKLELQEQFDNL